MQLTSTDTEILYISVSEYLEYGLAGRFRKFVSEVMVMKKGQPFLMKWQDMMKDIRIMGKMIKGLISFLAGLMLFGITALADDSAAIMETYTGDFAISVYLKGVGSSTDNMSIQIATSEAGQYSTEVLSELDKPMRTLVMIDNSISIPEANRGKIAELLQNMISDRLNNEEVSVATFGENINIVTDYSSDYTVLKQAIDSISYQDQETYLTDVLYDLISAQYTHASEDVYCRIVVVSDGVDNKSLGYTKDELYSLLRDVQVPIYTIGSAGKSNNDELENMFALSRMTSADYFLLDEVEDLFEITESLKQDRNIVKLTVYPPDEMMDGSRKAVRITFSDEFSLTAEVTMPQQVKVNEPQEEPVAEEPETPPEPEPEPESEVTPVEMVEDKDAELNTSFLVIFFIVVAAFIVITIVCVVLIVVNRKKNKPVEFETVDDNILFELEKNIRNSDDKTEMIGSFAHNNNDDGSTVMIWNQQAAYQLVLTDVNSPARSFRVPLSQSVVIGRKKELCDIALDYEKSVSGTHCEITARDGRFYIKDLQSSNGTYVNGSKVLTESEIFSGNVLKFGRLEMRFEVR